MNGYLNYNLSYTKVSNYYYCNITVNVVAGQGGANTSKLGIV